MRFLTRQGASNQFFGFLIPFHGKETASLWLQKPTGLTRPKNWSNPPPACLVRPGNGLVSNPPKAQSQRLPQSEQKTSPETQQALERTAPFQIILKSQPKSGVGVKNKKPAMSE
jgi:hypothetical protein